MALRKGAVSFRFGGGINTKTDPKAVPPVQLLELENGVFTRSGSIAKRYGYAELSSAIDGSATALSGLIRLGRRDREILGFTASGCYSRRPDAPSWSDTGVVYSVVGADRPVVRTGTEQTMPDHASLGGVSVYAWEDSRGGVWYTAADEISGRIHVAPTQADASGISPRCVAVGTQLHVYYANATLGRVYVIVVNPSSPSAAVTPVILVDDLSTTNPVYDACSTTRAGTPAAIAWHENATDSFRAGYVHSSGVLGGPLTGLPTVITRTGAISAASPVAVAWAEADADEAITIVTRTNDGTGNIVAWHYIVIAEVLTFGAAVTVTPSTTPLRIAVAWETETPLCWIAVEEFAAAASNRYVVINSVTLLIPGTPRTQRSVGLASRAWSIDDGVFAYFVHDTTYFNVYLALRLADSTCVARTLPGLAGDAPARKHLASAHVSADTASVALPYVERLESENGDQFGETGIRLATLDFDSEDSHQHAQLGRGLYLGGACPQHYDGRKWAEQGFHVGPELIATVNGGSGSLTASGTYLYRVWYEETDAQGETHRGPVSFGTLVTLGVAEDEVTLTLPTLRVTKKTNVRICVARSRAAQTGSTADLFRVASLDPTTAGAANGYVANDPTVDTVSFNDRMSDAVLETQEPLYTNGGILSTDPSALGHVVVESKGRLIFTDPSDENAIRYSQPIEEGFGVECPPELVIKCPPFGGAVTALAGQDGEVIVFKESAIMAFGGDGPLPSGDTSTSAFSAPRLISSDVGCTDPASIVLTPNGHMFKSAKGIYLIDRSGQVSYVGAPAEGYNAQRVTAATVLPDRTAIVFLTDAESGATLLHDHLYGQWGVFTNHLGRDAVVVADRYYYLRNDGRVFAETAGAYSDAGQRIRLRLATAWIHVAEALQGFQRFWNLYLLGTWVSPHQLSIQSRVDYQGPGPWSEPQYLDATGEVTSAGWITGEGADPIGEDPITGSVYGEGIYGEGEYGGTPPDIYQWRYHIGGRGQSVQFRFEDFERDGLAGASFELTEMLIEGGVAGTAVKPISAARSA